MDGDWLRMEKTAVFLTLYFYKMVGLVKISNEFTRINTKKDKNLRKFM